MRIIGGYESAAGKPVVASSVAVDSEGSVWVADCANDRITRLSPDGDFLDGWGVSGTGQGELYHPYDVALDAAGFLYVLDEETDRRPSPPPRLSPSAGTPTCWADGENDGRRRPAFGVRLVATAIIGSVTSAGFRETFIMAIATRISNEAYERLALAEPDRKWELWDGQPREKPGMTYAHNEAGYQLGFMLGSQLDRSAYRVRVDAGRVHRPSSTYFIPDVFVFPTAYITPRLRRDDVLEVYDQPLPFVAEVWSRSTGDYDVTEKLASYRQRGDREIWFFHPYERTLTAWRRQADGSYAETRYQGGIVPVLSLPGVAIDLDALLDG